MTSDVEKKFQILHQFVKEARSNLDDGAWDYLVGGAETETTQKRNRLGFDKLAFRPRVMRDVSGLNASVDFLGRNLRLPIIMAPIGSLQQFSEDGGAGVSKAAGTFGAAHMLSSVCDPGLEAVADAAPNAARIYQLAMAGNVTLLCFYAKTQMGWREKAPEDLPAQQITVYQGNDLSPEEWAQKYKP